MSNHTVPVDAGADAYSVVLCPLCKSEWTHLDEVRVAGRPREDGDIFPVRVDAGGHVTQGLGVVVPFGELGLGRRHTISIVGWCEGCGERFAFAFQQHKGQTLLSTLAESWRAAT